MQTPLRKKSLLLILYVLLAPTRLNLVYLSLLLIHEPHTQCIPLLIPSLLLWNVHSDSLSTCQASVSPRPLIQMIRLPHQIHRLTPPMTHFVATQITITTKVPLNNGVLVSSVSYPELMSVLDFCRDGLCLDDTCR